MEAFDAAMLISFPQKTLWAINLLVNYKITSLADFLWEPRYDQRIMDTNKVRAVAPRSEQANSRRTQESRRNESEQRILRAAVHLIAGHGSAGATMAEIGLAAGYSRGLPSARFGSKAALLESLIDYIEVAFRGQIEQHVGSRRGLAAVRARISAHLVGASQGAESMRALYLLYMESLSIAPEIRGRIAGLGQLYRDGFARHLDEAKTLGEIPSEADTVAYATVILGALRGIITQWLIEGTAINMAVAERTLAEMITRTFDQRLPPSGKTDSGRKKSPNRR
ncbi:TetR/AcrR family transcriptional regulator [Bradyrhizobium manausense]|uniref:TetR/AcrR family transcriptional regulator n=1 Tax=Bradyrhizobium manausense TaxID=989370 RepID=UPI001BA5D4CA|nr:TetR/AcrR family transcriptional regulator [Bradyrhizobium manausense]MBR0684369.1 TetR/AcrR family transcriptional regulator [Bradyrhizobium manausense]